MAKQRIFFDKKEVVLQYNDGRNWVDACVHASKVKNVLMTNVKARKFIFFKDEYQKIVVSSAQLPTITYSSKRAKEHFDGYVEGFRKFCADNHVTLKDNL